MSLLDQKEKNRKKFVRTGSGRRQDHATRGNDDRFREWDDIEDKVRYSRRRDLRRGAEEIEVELEEAEGLE